MTQEIIKSLNDARLNKTFTANATATQGLQGYDLEQPAKLLIPFQTPLRNLIPRKVGGFGAQANWKAITAVNTTKNGLKVNEGHRGVISQHQSIDRFATFKSLGKEGAVTFEADYAAQGFEDLKSLAVKGTLTDVMIQEELLDYSGNALFPIGKTNTPTVSSSSSGGSISAGTYNVIAVALTNKGFLQVNGINNGQFGQSFVLANAQLQSSISTVGADGSTITENLGVAQKSDSVSVVLTGSTSTITVSVPVTIGAVAYAYFVGTSGNEVLAGVSTINSIVLTSNSPSTWNVSNLSASDCSADSGEYDGILTQILSPNSGSYVKLLGSGTAGVGTTLTSDGAGGVQEIEEALYSFYSKYRLSPSKLIVDAKTAQLISKIVIANGGAPLVRMTSDLGNGLVGVMGGSYVGSYFNKITQNVIQILVHPNACPGSILFWSDSLPYQLNNVGNILQKYLRKDYVQFEWPVTTRSYQYGVYFDGVLQNYFPPAFGFIGNIAV